MGRECYRMGTAGSSWCGKWDTTSFYSQSSSQYQGTIFPSNSIFDLVTTSRSLSRVSDLWLDKNIFFRLLLQLRKLWKDTVQFWEYCHIYEYMKNLDWTWGNGGTWKKTLNSFFTDFKLHESCKNQQGWGWEKKVFTWMKMRVTPESSWSAETGTGTQSWTSNGKQSFQRKRTPLAKKTHIGGLSRNLFRSRQTMKFETGTSTLKDCH